MFVIIITTGWWCNFTILENDGVRQWGWDDIPYMKWKIIQMFETTNQTMSCCL